MTREAARAFVERMRTDEAFREKVPAVEGTEERLALVRAEGYDLTLDQLGEHANALRDACVEGVSAGVFSPSGCWEPWLVNMGGG